MTTTRRRPRTRTRSRTIAPTGPRAHSQARSRIGPRTRSRARTAAAPDSRQRILDAATTEFALRGFGAATVDRIAARARLNKAMIYYHFHSKRALYSAVLRDMFTLMGGRLAAIASSGAAPADKMDRFVSTFVLEGKLFPQIAPIMLREIAEGGRRLDEETYTNMVRVAGIITAIINEGRGAGDFAPVDPLLLYLTTVWPIVVYLATSPIRNAVARIAHFDADRLDADRFIRHLQMLNRRALMPAAAGPATTGEMS